MSVFLTSPKLLENLLSDKESIKMLGNSLSEHDWEALLLSQMENPETLKKLCTYWRWNGERTIDKLIDVNTHRYNLQAALPFPNRSYFGKKVCDVPEYKLKHMRGNGVQASEYGTMMNEFNKNHRAEYSSITDLLEGYEIIEKYLAKGKGCMLIQTCTIFFAAKVFTKLRDINDINSLFPKLLGMVNACLKEMNVDITSDSRFKMHGHACVYGGVEAYIWIPERF